MSVLKMRKNFYRIATLIIDYGADSMRSLLDHFIQKNYKVSFKDFVSNHQHEIYHQFNNAKCCQCSRNYHPPYKTTIGVWQMERLFDKNKPKLQNHKPTSKCEYCCSIVNSTLQIEHIDITLLRFFLVTFFEEEFWQSCFTSGILFHDFLNTHKHDIFHLLQLNTPCCICIAHPGYTAMVLTEKDRLNKTQWKTMFHTSELPCTQHRNNCPNGYTLNPCSVSATVGIRHSNLDGRARMIILSKFCDLIKQIDELVKARNTVFAHAIKGELSDEEFRQLWVEIENSIIYVSNITSKVNNKKLCILELREKSLEESMCLELQCLILKQMHGDELVLEICRKLQDTVEMVKESIDLKLQQIELQITVFTSNMSDVVRNELSVKLNEYSDTTRNIIDITRREIEFHDEDTTYVKISAVTTATDLLDNNNLLILFGRAGSGKTSTTLEIASLFHAKGYIVMKLEQNLAANFKTYFISKNKQLIIFEDLFGKADIRYNDDIHSNLLNVLKPHVSNGVSKFIITVRSYKSEVATYHQLLSEAGVLNLNEKSSLSDLEKERILTMYATHNELEICSANMQNIVATNSYLGFPEACRLFCSFEKFFAMGHLFFTSPTEVLQDEINTLKKSGYDNIDSALQYCVLICLMIDYACEDSFGKNIRRVAHESNDPSNNFKNINCSVIEYLCHSLYYKEIMLTIEDLHQMCKELTNKYIKKDLNSNTYVFQHQTVFEAVLSSYWHHNTMADVIKYFKANILAEHVRSFDSIVKRNKKYLIVPEDKCTELVHKLFETFLANYNEIFKCYSLIKQSKLMLCLFNLKLDVWYSKEQNILNCDWIIVYNFIRPLNYKRKNNIICAKTEDKFLVQRLLNELENWEPSKLTPYDRLSMIHRYIMDYGCEKFVKMFNDKLRNRFHSKENVVNCNLYLIEFFIRPTTFTIENGQIGTVTNDGWLINRLINTLMDPEPSKLTGGAIALRVRRYIKTYGCGEFVNIFNETLTEWFQSNENVVNCDWNVITVFIRPTTFTGHIRTFTNDGWLIERLINRLVNPEPSNLTAYAISWWVQRYITKYGCREFVNIFNEKLTERFQCKESVLNSNWNVIEFFIRPTTFTIKNGQIGSVINDGWLIQRLVNRLVNPEPFNHTAYDISFGVQRYITKYGCGKFVNVLNETLTERYQCKENIMNCTWNTIEFCIRPTTFPIKNGQIGTFTKDGWLIQRLINRLMNPDQSEHTGYDKTLEVQRYITKYGCRKFVSIFNERLTEWFQSKENIENCNWNVIDYFIRPTTFTIGNGQIGSFTNDDWLIQKLIIRLKKFEPSKLTAYKISWEVQRYIQEYGCRNFVHIFNKTLTEWFQSKESVVNCNWNVIETFIRPTTFTIANGQIGIFTNDGWLIQRLINRLMDPEPSKLTAQFISWGVKRYITKYGCGEFVNIVNDSLKEWFQSKENVVNCNWNVIETFIRPTTFPIQNGHIGTVTNDGWLIQRLINRLANPDPSKLTGYDISFEVQKYITKYGCGKFVSIFNETLLEWFQSKESIVNCNWNVIEFFIRPTTFTIENGQIGTFTNDSWLIQRLINRLVNPAPSKLTEYFKSLEVQRYITEYGCGKFVDMFNEKLTEKFQCKEIIMNCNWNVIEFFIRPSTFTIENGQIGAFTNDDWLIQRLINRLTNPDPSTLTAPDTASEFQRFIKECGCGKSVYIYNETLKEWFPSKEIEANFTRKMIEIFIRPTTYTIENGRIGTFTNDGWLIQKLINRLMNPSKLTAYDISREVQRYISDYGCEKFVNNCNEKLKAWILSNIENCNLHLFTYFVRPQSWLYIEKSSIYIHDEQVILFLFSKLEQHANVYTVKSYIRNYGSFDFITIFNERLKKKGVMLHVLDQKCTWEYLELFYDNVASSDANDIDKILEGSDIDKRDLSDLDSSISMDTNRHSDDSESDSNIDVDSSNSSDDSESDSNIDVDSCSHSEESQNETNHHPTSYNNGNNGVLVMMK